MMISTVRRVNLSVNGCDCVQSGFRAGAWLQTRPKSDQQRPCSMVAQSASRWSTLVPASDLEIAVCEMVSRCMVSLGGLLCIHSCSDLWQVRQTRLQRSQGLSTFLQTLLTRCGGRSLRWPQTRDRLVLVHQLLTQ